MKLRVVDPSINGDEKGFCEFEENKLLHFYVNVEVPV
jgi:hypothetical protein